jgi:hypothetical protein
MKVKSDIYLQLTFSEIFLRCPQQMISIHRQIKSISLNEHFIFASAYIKDFILNGNDKFPHIALARAQDDSKGLSWIILTLPVLSTRQQLFTQRIYLSYSDETRIHESSNTTHLVLTWQILFTHLFRKIMSL